MISFSTDGFKLLVRTRGGVAAMLVAAVLCAFFTYVDLEPEITPDFFFASDSEIYHTNKRVTDVFPSQQQILLNISAERGLDDKGYIGKIDDLTQSLLGLDGITEVQSVTRGPSSLKTARENPLWRRILIGNNEESSFIIAFVDTNDFSALVYDVEDLAAAAEEPSWFKVRISGLPYVVEQIRRNLTADMKSFTLGAIGLSAIVLLLVFRSLAVVAGALIACISAAMLTLAVQSIMGISIGVLTANLGTIIFVLTLTHVIFLVSNWVQSEKDNTEERLAATVRHTFKASFWAGITTLLGFVSLIFVEAKPLNELGIGGTIGAAAALLCAYLIFPAFLGLSKVKPSNASKRLASLLPRRGLGVKIIVGAALLGAIVIGGTGFMRLNTDPSLLAYFDEDTPLHKGLYYVDENGGSNPLLLVVRRKAAQKLDNEESYKALWQLQKALDSHEAVGSVISLPVIMAEGDSHWLGGLLPWDWLLDILSKPEFGSVAKSFVTPDRTHALFMLRMREGERERTRLEIMEDIQKIPSGHDFELTITGGTYYLQGELASAVASSMTVGVIMLLIIFGCVAYGVSRNLRVTAALVVCAGVISAIVLGTLGVFGIPVDIISSPAINICLGLIVDDMIHLTVTARRYVEAGKGSSMTERAVWRAALDSQSWPAVISTLAIMIGFSVFALSDFPPSRRFGLEIAYGAGLAVFLALVVFPFLAQGRVRK
ncbi:MAG: MMPL family transporter [Alphaproteobacteria bacterium]|nr:MMPL family transporter [Alphaproteobacteria bacterium]